MKRQLLLLAMILLVLPSMVAAAISAVTATEALELNGHSLSAISSDWSGDGSRLVVGDGKGTIHIWDTASGDSLMTLEGHEREVSSVQYSNDNLWIASAGLDGTVRIWNANTGEEAQHFSVVGDYDFAKSAVWSTDDSLLAVVANKRVYADMEDKEEYYATLIYDTATWEVVATLNGHVRDVSEAAWSPDGTLLATSGLGGEVNIWDTATWEPVKTLELDVERSGFTIVEWSPDGTKLLTAHFNSELQIWDYASGEVVTTMQGHLDFVGSASWSPDGRLVASGGGAAIIEDADATVRIWDAETGAELSVLDQHERGVRHVSWSPDGLRLASSGDDGIVRVWDIEVQE